MVYSLWAYCAESLSLFPTPRSAGRTCAGPLRYITNFAIIAAPCACQLVMVFAVLHSNLPTNEILSSECGDGDCCPQRINCYLFLYLRNQYGPLGFLLLVECKHGLQWEFTDDITIEHEEWIPWPIIQYISGHGKWSSSAHRLVLLHGQKIDMRRACSQKINLRAAAMWALQTHSLHSWV